MPAPTGYRGWPPAKAWQDWFTIRLRTWANVISPEFETELVNMVQLTDSLRMRSASTSTTRCHHTSLARTCRQAARSSECYTKRSLCARLSTRRHFTRGLPKLPLTVRQWLTDLRKLQAAGSSPSKETVMQSLKTVTGGIRDLNNVHEITDLLAPNDPGKLYSAIERKAAGWAVMDADTRLNDSSAGAGKGVKGDHKGAHSATIPCKHFAKGNCARGDMCRFSHKSLDSKPSGKGDKGKKSNSERDRCKKCGKITNPPPWAKPCPENFSSSAQTVLASTPISSPLEVAPPGLSTL